VKAVLDAEQTTLGRLITVGHGTLELAALCQLLTGAGVELLVDVRRFPASRRLPQLSSAALQPALEQAGLAYRWEERLGGRRRLPKPDPEEDSWWTVEAFRAYAAHTRTPAFQAALAELMRDLDVLRVAVMCSESVWWRCHRRLIADVVVAEHGRPVSHLMPNGAVVPHPLATGARRRPDGLLCWDGQ